MRNSRRLSVALCILFSATVVRGQSTAQGLDAEQQLFLTLINNFRAQNGVGTLQVSTTLQDAAQWMSNDMATQRYFSHTDSLGRDPFVRMAAFGYSFAPAGENIAAGYSEAQATFNQWAASPGHRSNMLNGSFKVIGIGRAYDAAAPYRWYWTTEFGGHVDAVVVNPKPSATPLLFVPVQPCRLADTRAGQAAATAFSSPVPVTSPNIGWVRTLTIQNACGVPGAAQAYSLNVTAVPRQPLGFLTIWPTGQTQPLVSTLNAPDGRIKASAAIVPSGANSSVSVFTTDPSDVIVDVNGYFVAPGGTPGLAFYAMAPCRVVDTRDPARGVLGSPGLSAMVTRSFNILSASACNIPASARVFSLNYTVVPSGSLSYLTTWPTGKPQPVVSTLNAPTGVVTANAAIVPADSGSVEVFATNNTHLIIDINGYFAPPGGGSGLSFYNLKPCRVLDTRLPWGTLPITGTFSNINPAGCGAPASARAYVFGATAVAPGSMGYLTLWASGAAQPLVSTLNAADGSVTSNMAIVPSLTGSVNAFVSDPSHLIVDISGYFAP